MDEEAGDLVNVVEHQRVFEHNDAHAESTIREKKSDAEQFVVEMVQTSVDAKSGSQHCQ